MVVVGVNEDVLRLYITMEDQVVVQVEADREELLLDEGSHCVVLRSVLGDEVVKVEGSKRSLHHQGELVLELVEVYQRDDVAVIQGVEEDSFSGDVLFLDLQHVLHVLPFDVLHCNCPEG